MKIHREHVTSSFSEPYIIMQFQPYFAPRTLTSVNFQYVGWYDDDSLGGLEKTVEKMVNTDPNFGIVYSILVYAVVYIKRIPPPPNTTATHTHIDKY